MSTTTFLFAGHEARLPAGREMLTEQRTIELCAPFEEEKNTQITKLSISGKSFGREAATVMSAVLAKLSKLTELDASDIIAGRNTEEAVEVLEIISAGVNKSGAKLVTLNLSDNAFGLRGIKAITQLFQGQNELLHVYFNNNGLQGDAVNLLVEHIVSSHDDKKSKLHSFEIFNNLLTDAGAIALVPLIEASPQLQHFRMATTRVSNAGGLAITKALLTTKNLTHLNISDNTFGEEAGSLLPKALKQQTHLTHLYLADIGVGEDNMKLIIKSLRKCAPHLQYLDLSASELTSSHGHQLARVLASKHSLKYLKLEDNELKNNAVLAILETVRHHKGLQYINVSNTQITSKTLKALKVLADHEALKELHVNGNQFVTDAVDELTEAFEKLGSGFSGLDENEEDEDDDASDGEDGDSGDESDTEEGEAAEQKSVDEVAKELAEAQLTAQ